MADICLTADLLNSWFVLCVSSLKIRIVSKQSVSFSAEINKNASYFCNAFNRARNDFLGLGFYLFYLTLYTVKAAQSEQIRRNSDNDCPVLCDQSLKQSVLANVWIIFNLYLYLTALTRHVLYRLVRHILSCVYDKPKGMAVPSQITFYKFCS